MTIGYSLNIERLYGSGIVRVAAKHLLRELVAELGADSHIDATRIGDNFILRGPDTAAGVAGLAKSLMEAAGVTKCRKGAVTALELLFTLPPAAGIDPRQYFEQAVAWAERHFGVPVLSCVVHMDEGAPHAHALLLPLIDGHMVGSDLHGGKAKLAAMQTSFHAAVGAPHGLPKYVPQKRLSAPLRTAAIELARAALQTNSALTDAVIEALLTPHAKDPAPLLLALGIPMPAPAGKAKDFASIMTAVCKPEPRSPIGKGNRKPIGKAILAAPVSSLPDTCVGKGIALSPIPAREQPPAPATASTADLPTSRADFVRLVEQREPATGDTHQQDDQRQHSAENSAQHATLTPCASLQAVSLAAGAGNLSDTPTAPAGQGDRHGEIRRLAAGAAPLSPSSDIRTIPDNVPARQGITENTESGSTSAPTPTPAAGGSVQGHAEGRMPNGMRVRLPALEEVAEVMETPAGGSVRHPWPSHPPAGSGDYQRQRDNDQPAATRCTDLGEFAPATGPPPSSRNLYPCPNTPARRQHRELQTKGKTMKLKLNKDGSAVVRNGMPVYVRPNGAEQEIDGGAAWSLLLTKHFESSPTMERLKIPADLAASFFGPSFTIADGKLVAQDKHGIQLYSSVKHGEAAGFDEAFGKLVDLYHSKDMILRESGAPVAPGGASAGAPAGQTGTGSTITRAQFDAMAPDSKGKFMAQGGRVADGPAVPAAKPATSAPAAGTKTITRAAFDQMPQNDRHGFFKSGGKVSD